MNYQAGGERPDKTREIKDEINIHSPHFIGLTMSWFFLWFVRRLSSSPFLLLSLSRMKSKTPKMWCLNQTHTKRDEFQNKHINLICRMFLQLLGRKWILYTNCLSFSLPPNHLVRWSGGEAQTGAASGPWHGVNVCDARLRTAWPPLSGLWWWLMALGRGGDGRAKRSYATDWWCL